MIVVTAVVKVTILIVEELLYLSGFFIGCVASIWYSCCGSDGTVLVGVVA